MSSPHVAGLIGLMLSLDPTLTIEEQRQVLKQTGQPLTDPYFGTSITAKRIDASQALDHIEKNSVCAAQIMSPIDYESVEFHRSTLNILAAAGGRDASTYRLEYSDDLNAPSWTVLSTNPTPASAVLHESLSTSSLIGGYYLRLNVYDSSGHVCGTDVTHFQYSPFGTQYVFDAAGDKDLVIGYDLAQGDVTGDGIDDLLIGAPNCIVVSVCSTTPRLGKVYLVPGGNAHLASGCSGNSPCPPGFPSAFRLTDPLVVPFSWIGTTQQDLPGTSVAIVNIDGDSYGDVVVGYPGSSIGFVLGGPKQMNGQLCVYLGVNQSSWTQNMTPSAADYCFSGEDNFDRFAFYFANAGDIDGDGLDDVMASSAYNDVAGQNFGRTYILYAADKNAWSASQSVSAAAGTILDGGATTLHGQLTVNRAGDINADGFGDVILGTRGSGYLFYGSANRIQSRPIPSADITFNSSSSHLGYDSTPAGDINGDGIDDLLIGSSGSSLSKMVGGPFIYFGSLSHPSHVTLDPTNSLHYTDGDLTDYSQYGLAALGDINNDGLDDFAVGSRYYTRNIPLSRNGIVKTYYGSSGTGYIQSDEGEAFFLKDHILLGGHYLGHSLVQMDFDNNGAPDLVVSAPYKGNQFQLFVFSL